MRSLKLILCIALSIVLFLCVVPPAFAQPSVTLDGRLLSFDVPPQMVGGRTFVPLRAIFEKLGASVAWDDITQTVTATRGNRVIKLTIGRTVAYINGTPVTLDMPGRSIRGRTMVPLRFVGEGLGAEVNWDKTTQRVTISSMPNKKSVVKINYPHNGAVVSVREMIIGTSQNVSPGQAIWVLVRPHVGHRYHPQNRHAKIEGDGDWSAFAYIGRENEDRGNQFDIVVVLANREAQGIFNAYLEKSRKERTWLGLGELPAGAVRFDHIIVTRK